MEYDTRNKSLSKQKLKLSLFSMFVYIMSPLRPYHHNALKQHNRIA